MSNDAGLLARFSGAAARPVAARGMLFVLSSPSGGGKSTIARALRKADPELALSVSCTTRAPRPGEQDGKDYYFLSPDGFEAKVASGQMLEHAEVFGRRYGTPREPVEAWLEAGRDVLFDIDWQGARQLREAMPGDMVSVFILPPSMQALAERLRARGQDSEDVISDRMQKAAAEISHWGEYDYVIINDDLANAQLRVEAILVAERQKRVRQTGLGAFVETLEGS